MPENSFYSSSVTPFRFVFLLWGVFFFQYLFYPLDLTGFGIVPRTVFGLIGILTAPLLHGDFVHLLSNTIPLLFLGSILFFFYASIGRLVFFRAYIWTNLLVWLFARPANHIGASGLVYGLAFFLIFYGLFRRDFISLAISVIIMILYGGVFYGVLPTDPRISWESHLAGGLVGITTAINFSNKRTA